MPSVDDNETATTNGPSASTPDRSSSGGLDDWVKALREMAPYLDLGWRLAGAAAGPPLLGHFLVDAWLGTTPWGLFVGGGVGVAVAALQLKRLHGEFGS